MQKLTEPAEPGGSHQLHQLVVAHVSQQVLQASLSAQSRQLMAAAAATRRSGDGGVVQVLVHLTAVFLIFVRLWFLMKAKAEPCYSVNCSSLSEPHACTQTKALFTEAHKRLFHVILPFVTFLLSAAAC